MAEDSTTQDKDLASILNESAMAGSLGPESQSLYDYQNQKEKSSRVAKSAASSLLGPQFQIGYDTGDESWGEFTEPGGTATQIFDPLDIFGMAASRDAAKAAKAQADAALKAQQFLEAQYATLKGMQTPFIEGGKQSFGLQSALSGLYGSEKQAAAEKAYMQSLTGAVGAGIPKGLESMPAGLAEALKAYGTGIASQDYGNYFNRLGYGAGLGQAAASSLGGVNVDISKGIAGAMQAGGEAGINNILMQQQIRGQTLGNLATLAGAAIEGYGNYKNAQQAKLYGQ